MYQDGAGGLRIVRGQPKALARGGTKMFQFIVLNNIGSDAGYWVFRDGSWQHVGGWGVDAMREVQAGLAVLKASSQLRTPELAQSIADLVTKAIGPELADHAAGEHTVIIT